MEGDENLELEQLLGGGDGSLGELPATIHHERGERFTGERPEPPPGAGGVLRLPQGVQMPVPRDVINQAAAELAARDAPAKQQQNPYEIMSTFPALPINAQQFAGSGVIEPDLEPGDDPAITQGFFTFTVPDGFNGILRGFRFVASQVLTDDQFTVTLLARGVVHRTYEALQLGQALNEFFPVYVLAGPRQTFSLQFDTLDNDPAYTPEIRVWFTGQLLVDTGKELQYEPANEVKR